jgi:hypothetical protein
MGVHQWLPYFTSYPAILTTLHHGSAECFPENIKIKNIKNVSYYGYPPIVLLTLPSIFLPPIVLLTLPSFLLPPIVLLTLPSFLLPPIVLLTLPSFLLPPIVLLTRQTTPDIE